MSKNVFQYEQTPIPIDYSVRGLIRLNLNENLVIPKSILREAFSACGTRLEISNYPPELDCGNMKRLREELACYCQVESWKNIALGCGGDQLIDLLCQLKLESPKDTLVTVRPTFSMYSVNARKTGGEVRELQLGNSTDRTEPFKLEIPRLVRLCRSNNVKILALASPNNPTGIQYTIDEIREILESIPPNVLLMLDEAYVEYADYSAKQLMREFDNLALLRTFSKAFGLASQRVGYLVTMNEELANRLDRFQLPFPLNSLSVLMALNLLEKKDLILKYAQITSKLRQDLENDVSNFDQSLLRIIPNSRANFVLVSSRHSKRIFTSLISKYKIAVKYIPNLEQSSDFLRITVGRKTQNRSLINALAEIISSLR